MEPDSSSHSPDDPGKNRPEPSDSRYAKFPQGFFAKMDQRPDAEFYATPRYVTHIDEGAVTSLGTIYADLGLNGRILDLMSSWISHFEQRPEVLVVAGMNAAELSANEQAAGGVLLDLNALQRLPFADGSFDGATCCVSVDYLTRPLEVFDEVARVLRPGAPFCASFSNRCFPSKVIQGWAQTDDDTHIAIVSEYFRLSGPWTDLQAAVTGPPDRPGDPLHAVWARQAEHGPATTG